MRYPSSIKANLLQRIRIEVLVLGIVLFFGFALLATQAANAAPTISLTAPTNNKIYNLPATVVLNANIADNDDSTAKVEFYNGTTLLDTDTSSPYSFIWNNVPAGSYSLTAQATTNQGLVVISAPVTIKVNAPPTVTLTAPANNAYFAQSAQINLTANAADSDGTIAKVQFYNGTTLLGSDTSAPYSFSWANVAAGTYNLTAKATDNQSGVASSVPITIVVNAPPAVTLSAPANNANYSSTAIINLAATASDSDGSIAKVEFYRGGTLISTATNTPYTATLASLAMGNYTLTAKATDNKGAVTTSAPITVHVVPNASPTIQLSAPINNSSFDGPATVGISVLAADSDGIIAQVDFFLNGALIGTTTELGSDNAYHFVVNDLAAGSYSITARATDNLGTTTLASTVNMTVVVSAQKVYFIHTDHLNTPRLIADSAGQTVWQWDSDPFGSSDPNENPSGLGKFTFNQRFPGQYFDKETNLHYNYYRDYDPQTGQYVESDPIGLKGGINTYAYVGGNPVSRVDPLGLWSFTFGGYLGAGFQVTFGNDNGNGFMTGRVGFGFGAGYSYDPNGGIPGPALQDPSVGGVVLSDSVVGNFSAGPITGTVEGGYARNYSNGQSSTYGAPTPTTSTPWWGGIRADASVGAQCTIYSRRQ